MRAWTYLYLPSLCVSVFLGCNKPEMQSVPAEPTRVHEKAAPTDGPAPAKPFCTIETSPYKFQEESLVSKTWNLKLYGLKSLTSRLMIISDGKVKVSNEVTYTWEKWEPSTPPATGQLVLVVHDGTFFGARGKRLPSLAMDFQGGPRGKHLAWNSGLFLEGDLKDNVWSFWPWNFEKGKVMICSLLYAYTGDQLQNVKLGSDLENVIAISREGRPVLAIEVETKVQEQFY